MTDQSATSNDFLENQFRATVENTQEGLNPADLVDYAIIAASYIVEGTITLKDVTKRMVEEFGEGIEKHMPKIAAEAQVLYEELDKAADEVAQKNVIKIAAENPSIVQAEFSLEIALGAIKIAKWMSEIKSQNPDYTNEQLKVIRKASESYYEYHLNKRFGDEHIKPPQSEEKLPDQEDTEASSWAQSTTNSAKNLLADVAAEAIDDVLLGAIKIAKGTHDVGQWMTEMKAEDSGYTDKLLHEIRKASEIFYENEIMPMLGDEAIEEVVEERASDQVPPEALFAKTATEGSKIMPCTESYPPSQLGPEFGENNTIFTKAAAEEARKIIRRKLGLTN